MWSTRPLLFKIFDLDFFDFDFNLFIYWFAHLFFLKINYYIIFHNFFIISCFNFLFYLFYCWNQNSNFKQLIYHSFSIFQDKYFFDYLRSYSKFVFYNQKFESRHFLWKILKKRFFCLESVNFCNKIWVLSNFYLYSKS